MLCPVCKKTITDGKVFCNYCGYCFDANYHVFMMEREKQRQESLDWKLPVLHEPPVSFAAGKTESTAAVKTMPEKKQIIKKDKAKKENRPIAKNKKRRILGLLAAAGMLIIGMVLYSVMADMAEPMEQAAETNAVKQTVSCDVSEREGLLGGTVFDFTVWAPDDCRVRLEYKGFTQIAYSYNGKAEFSIPAASLGTDDYGQPYIHPVVTVVAPNGAVVDSITLALEISPDDIA